MYRLNNMIVVEEYPLSELENYKGHHRLRVFYFFGTTCVVCGVAGTKFLKLKHKELEEYHLDVYTNRMRLITVDHIIPKALGGRNTLDNLQPMCTRCNQLKSNNDATNEELRIMVRSGEKVRSIDVPSWLAFIRNSKAGLGL